MLTSADNRQRRKGGSAQQRSGRQARGVTFALVAALGLCLSAPVPAQPQPGNGATAVAGAGLGLWESICPAVNADTLRVPTDRAGRHAWLGAHDLQSGMPDGYESVAEGSALFADSQIFSRQLADYALVLQLRTSGSCRVYFIGPAAARVPINQSLSAAIDASPLRWSAFGAGRPGPDGVTGQVYTATSADGRSSSLFHINGGPAGSPIIGVLAVAPRTRDR